MSSNEPSWPSESGGTPPPPPPPGGTGPLDLAPFSERAIALFIDIALVIAIGIAMNIVTMIARQLSSVLGGLLSFVTFVVSVGLSFAIIALGEGGPLGQTPGKHIRGIKVVKEDGSQLGIGGGVIRWLGRILDTIICGLPIGYLWPLFDDERRAWHDLVAGTRVINGGSQGGVADWLATFRG